MVVMAMAIVIVIATCTCTCHLPAPEQKTVASSLLCIIFYPHPPANDTMNRGESQKRAQQKEGPVGSWILMSNHEDKDMMSDMLYVIQDR